MSKIPTAHDDLLKQLTSALPEKPDDDGEQDAKRAYSQEVSKTVALAVAAALRKRGLEGARPTEGGLDEKSGAERQMAGGIGAKKVDVTWSTEESGLLIAFSIKSINFKDGRSANFQKNLTNRRGDLLFESITLHRRFPYSVLVGLFFLNSEAQNDGTTRRKSTFENTHIRLALFKGRIDPSGRDEQYEHLYIGLLHASPTGSSCNFYRVGEAEKPITLDNVLEESLQTLTVRNADMYTLNDGRLRSSQRSSKKKNPKRPKKT